VTCGEVRKPNGGLKQKESQVIRNQKLKKGKLDTQQMPSVKTKNTAMGREHRGPCCHQHGCVHCDVTRVLSLYKAGCQSQVCSKNPWVHDFPMTWPNNLKVNMGRSW
jgi:hypothetical protein